jgi:hypothetical protein
MTQETSLGDSRCLVMFEKPLESQPIVLVWYAALICFISDVRQKSPTLAPTFVQIPIP